MKKLLSSLFLFLFISCEAHCCWEFGVRADLLYWTTSQSDLDYTIVRDLGDQTNPFNVPLLGSKKFLDYGWDVGFRLNAHGSYDGGNRLVEFSWTQFHPGTKASEMPLGVNEYTIQVHVHPRISGSTALSRQTKATILQKYDSYDFLVGSSYFTSGCVSFCPKVGVRLVQLNQEFRIESKDLFRFTTTPIGDQVFVKYQTDLWGAGLHSAVESRVELGCQTHFFTHVGLSVLVTEINAKVKQVLNDAEPDVVDVKVNTNAMMPGANMAVGLGTYWTCSEIVNFHLDVAYEAVYWHETPKDMRFYDVLMVSGSALYDGNTLFHGLTLKAHLRF